jgi:hypothetical protein
VIPIYRLPLSPEEEVSLKHLQHFLSGYDRYLIAPRTLEIPAELLQGMSLLRFDDSYFAGLDGYNKLMLSRSFYRSFRSYDYILIYQLDCLVFSEDLEHWCAQGWDYLGAPWFEGHRGDTSGGLWAVGNGGLSLRKVSAFLEVLEARGLWASPMEVANETNRFASSPWLRRWFVRLKAVAHALGYKNTIRYFIRHFSEYEDIFWASHARHAVPAFRIASPEEALPFSFEYAPRYCFEKNGRRLPFGCHGWYKIDPEFWQPFLLRPPEVHRVPASEAVESAA